MSDKKVQNGTNTSSLDPLSILSGKGGVETEGKEGGHEEREKSLVGAGMESSHSVRLSRGGAEMKLRWKTVWYRRPS